MSLFRSARAGQRAGSRWCSRSGGFRVAVQTLLIAACLLGQAWAAEPFTLDSLLAEIAQRSPELQSRRAEVQAALERPVQARAFDDPMLMVELWQVPIGVQQMPLMITLRQPIPWPGKLAARAAVLHSDAIKARADVALSARNLRVEATRAYYDYRLAVRSLTVLRDTQRLLTAIVAAVDTRYRVGRAELAELLKAQADAAVLDNLLLDVERERDVTTAAMNILLARPADQAFGEPVTTPSLRVLPSLQQLTEQALAQRPELAGIRAALDQAQARQQAARIERAPDLAVWAGYMTMLRGGNDATFTLGLQTSIPSFSIAKNNAAAREAQAQEKAQRQTLVSTEARIRGEVRQALLRVEAAERHIWLHSKTLLPTAERAVQAAQAGYQSGRVSLVLLLDAARTLVDHRLEFERYQAEYGQRLAELEAAIGAGLPVAPLAASTPPTGELP